MEAINVVYWTNGGTGDFRYHVIVSLFGCKAESDHVDKKYTAGKCNTFGAD